MKGVVLNYNDIDDSHTCSYGVTDHTNGSIQSVGMISKKDHSNEDIGREVVRDSLQVLLEKDSDSFTIYNNSRYHPQLEISRFPHNIREQIYDNIDLTVESDASGTPSHSAEFIANAATQFISNNYARFDDPVSTNKAPGPQNKETEVRDSNSNYKYKYTEPSPETYYLYADASYHPNENTSSISYVIIGQNGGLFGRGKSVTPQTITRAEFLALLSGISVIQKNRPRCKIISYTDSRDVKRALNNSLMIDKGLNNTAESLTNNSAYDVEVRCIDRNSNSLADALAKVSRTRDTISIGRLNPENNTTNVTKHNMSVA